MEMQKTDEEITAELQKCLDDPRYFYNTYWQINGKPVTPISKEDWDTLTAQDVMLIRGRNSYRSKNNIES